MPPRVRRRFAQRFRFDTFDLLIGPEFEGRFTSEDEWQQLVDAMEGWYRVNGFDFEAEHAYPGSRSWAWWRFVAREAMPTPNREFTRLQELDALTVEEEAEVAARSRSAQANP